MSNFVITNTVYISPISKNSAKDIIVKNHYTHSWPAAVSLSLGIYIKNAEDTSFLDGNSDKLIGALIYGTPSGRQAAEAISDLIKINQVYELKRLFIHDDYGKNIESFCISLSFKWLKINNKNIKAILSYSDKEQNHKGIIYQATNFLYSGVNTDTKLMPNYSVSLTKDPYNWVHSRTVMARYGSTNVEHLKKMIGNTFWMKKESGKHKYIYILASNLERKKIMNNLKFKILPYPKSAEYEEEITEIVVDTKEYSSFFINF